MNDHNQDTGTIRARDVANYQPPSQRGVPVWLVLVIAGGALVLGGLTDRTAPTGRTPVAAAVAPSADQFLAHAVGVTTRAATLTARPGGAVLASLASGTGVRIGGRARVPVALGTREAYWVSPPGASPVYGWLWDTEVLVTSGEPPLLTRMPVAQVTEGVRIAQAAPAATGAPAVPAVPVVPAQVQPARAPVAQMAAPSAGGRVAIPWMPSSVTRWTDLFVSAGAKHGVDPELLAILCLVESGGGPNAVSPSGASGLIQVMPATGQGIAQERGIVGHTAAKLFDPETAVDFGAYYIAQQLARFGVDNDPDWQRSVELAAGAYNAGPGAQQRALAGGRLPAEGVRYTYWVGGMWRERHQATSQTFEQWMAAGGRGLVQKAGG